jgi:CheY-like chemotaxis protein
MQTAKLRNPVENGTPGVVRVLLAIDDVAVRLTLGAVLEKSGYFVDSAASSAEAMEKIEDEQYALILCDLDGESGDASRNVIKMAQTQDYRPATAYLRASGGAEAADEDADQLFIETVDVPALLTQIADLIASRAAGRARRAARRAS